MPQTPTQILTPAHAASVASVQTAAFGAAVTAGSTIIVLVPVFNNNTASAYAVTDTAGNTYTRDAFYAGVVTDPTNFGQGVFIFRASNVTGGGTFKITVTKGGAGTAYIDVFAAEVPGTDLVTPLDSVSAGNSGSGTTADTGTWNTANANDILFAVMVNNGGSGSITAPTGFTSLGTVVNGSDENGAAAYQVVSSTQSGIAPQFTGAPSSTWFAIGAAYKAAGGGTVYSMLLRRRRMCE